MKERKQQKKKRAWGSILFFGTCIGIGAVCGFFLPAFMERSLGKTADFPMFLAMMAVFLLLLYLACFIQIAVHECGHWLLGLWSGYRFSSFRLGNLMLMKDNGKLKVRRFSLKGTAGQCLMTPPDPYTPQIPSILYNLGGSLLNLAAALPFGLILWIGRPDGMRGMFCLVMALTGVLFAFINGVPFRLPSLNNDGSNALEIYKSKAAHRGFWIQLKCVQEAARGVRIGQMPEEWFELPARENMKYSLCAYVAMLAFSRAVDQMDFQRAQEIGQELIAHADAMPGLQKQLLCGELLYCEAVGLCRREMIEELDTPQLRKMLKSMKNIPSVHRIQYACALLIWGDEEAAQEHLKAFQRAARRYPYPSELEGEEELLAYARKVSEERRKDAESGCPENGGK